MFNYFVVSITDFLAYVVEDLILWPKIKIKSEYFNYFLRISAS